MRTCRIYLEVFAVSVETIFLHCAVIGENLTLTKALSQRERAGQVWLSSDAHRLQLFQRRILVFQEPNLCVVRTHTLAQQANRLQR